MGDKRSPEREQFLLDVFTTAIENYGHGWFWVTAYKWEGLPPSEAYAEITAQDDDKQYRVTIDTMARGLTVVREAELNGDVVRVNAKGEPLGFGGEARRQLLIADRTNGEDGDYDVIGALAVLECALFGRVIYA